MDDHDTFYGLPCVGLSIDDVLEELDEDASLRVEEQGTASARGDASTNAAGSPGQ